MAVTGAVVLWCLAACDTGTNSAGSDGQVVDGATFTMVLAADPGTLDPDATTLAGAYQTDRFLYDSLTNVDPQGRVVAGLAGAWKGTTTEATFTLRKGVTCSDGSALRASTVADNINHAGDPENASTRLSLYVPAGAKAVADDTAGTVTVTSPVPDAFLTRNVGGLHIVCDKGLKNRKLLKSGAVGTGMYRMTEAVPGDHYTLTRRKEYAWGPGAWKKNQPGLPDKVVLRIVANETTAANLLTSGAVNASMVTGPDQDRLRQAKLFRRDNSAPLGELWFNQKSGQPASDGATRRSLAQALNLQEIGRVVSGGKGAPPTGLVSGKGPCTQNTVGKDLSGLPAHDPAAAKKALDGAGWRAGPGGVRTKDGHRLSLTFVYPTSLGATMRSGAELIQKQWAAIGVGTSLRGVTDTELSQQVISGQGSWDAAVLPLTLSLPSQAVPFLSGPTPPKGGNYAHIDNGTYDAAVAEAAKTAGSAGCKEWARAERALFERADVVPFVNASNPFFGQRAVFELSESSLIPSSVRMKG
ncbi:ABC transporter substrate-binding protein [Streptomyces sp. V3I8]|uniref:ABC transporter substrate-binding protein n=1 Tax=Streptomyces sp. V3I8 TaxID=3042279 RepID=UPI0027D926CF|nr:ABC transporter substrate-binding protein [Streptomyces sp. V3I8]